MRRIATDRSRIETKQHCARQRWLEYHEQGVGIVPLRKALPLAVGGSVHVGLAVLLRMAATLEVAGVLLDYKTAEELAVKAALTDFSTYKAALDIGTEVTTASVALDTPQDAIRGDLAGVPAPYDEYLYQEQASLVEALVRAYARRRLRPLLAEFEVLEVEREGAWTLADLTRTHRVGQYDTEIEQWGTLEFLSRPDALLRSRLDGHLEILSYKTTGAWDVRKARDAEHDMQGLSEGIEVERRLGQRILAIRYEYILKGERWKDKDLAARFGIDWARAQKSHLVRRYECVSTPSRGANAGAFSVGDSCWSYDYHQEDGRTSKLSWANWDSRLVTDSGITIRQWIDKLDSATLTMSAADSTLGIEPREIGWSCDAQAVGYTATHPLDAVFLPPMTVYRNDDDLRDLVEQMESQEVTVAENVAAVESASDEDERRSLLNRHFPQTRRACCYPTLCAYEKVCYGGADIRRAPLDSGLYKIRVPNHPAETEMTK